MRHLASRLPGSAILLNLYIAAIFAPPFLLPASVGTSLPLRRQGQESSGGGMPETLPLPYGELASFSPDGSRMVFQPISTEFRTWKRYRGGMASDLWLYDFVNNTSEKITDFEGTDSVPMWHRNTIYFLTDRDERKKLNIWAYDLGTKKTRQITRFTEYDVKWPSIGPETIVFENGGKLHLLDLASEISQPISIQVPADLPEVRTKLKDLSKHIQNFSLSPSGKRALFEARGEVFTVPQKHGSVRNLTSTSGVAERFPAWSPDSRWLAYSKNMDNTESAVMIYDTVENKTHQVTSSYYSDTDPVFDPEGKYLFFCSNRSFTPVYGDMDSTWIYPNSTEIYAVTLRKDLGSPIAPRSDEEKVEEEKKKEKQEPKDEGQDRKDKGEPPPFLSSTEDTGAEVNDVNAVEAAEGDKDKKKPKPVNIDFEGFERRVVKLPIDAGILRSLHTVKGKLVYCRYLPAGAVKEGEPSGTLLYYDTEEREEKTVILEIDGYDISSDGKKVIYKSKSTYGIIDLAEGKNAGSGKIAVDKLKAWVAPRQEWQQIFNEAWRIERDYFYDPNMHGLDWKAIKKRYEALLPYIVDRSDLNYVIGEMIAELNTSHTYVSGGDLEQPERISVGLLGCDFQKNQPQRTQRTQRKDKKKLNKEDSAYRIGKIYAGAAWDAEVRSPLRQPGVDVNEGDYLPAVNLIRHGLTQIYTVFDEIRK